MSPNLITSLPPDLLLDSVLPLLDVRSLCALRATSKETKAAVDDEVFWKRRIAQDFNFPLHATARVDGYRLLYKRLHCPKLYVWGQASHGRLGFPSDHHLMKSKSALFYGGLVAPVQLDVGQPLVDLVAGGWSFHALTTRGEVFYWGVLDGEVSSYGMDPRRLPLPQRVLSLSSGRKHALALTESGQIFEWWDWEAPFQVVDERWNLGQGYHRTVIRQIEAGWGCSAALIGTTEVTSSTNAVSIASELGSIFVWWGPGHDGLEEQDSAPSSFYPAMSVHPVELPPLPLSDSLGNPRPATAADRISRIAAGDNFIIALTDAGQVFKIDVQPPSGHFERRRHAAQMGWTEAQRRRAERDEIETALMNGSRQWEYLAAFSEPERVAKLPAFQSLIGGVGGRISMEGVESSDLVPKRGPAPLLKSVKDMHITHITAHFQTFFAYSVPHKTSTSDMGQEAVSASGGVVLMGTSGTRAEDSPIVKPELQERGVIKITMGDYHHGALLDSGELLTWGAFSAGALGRGVSQHTNVVATEPGPANRPTVPPPFLGPRLGFLPPVRGWPSILPVPDPSPPPPPEDDPVPKPVLFEDDVAVALAFRGSETLADTKRSKRKYVFAASFGGWHSGALVVDLEDGDSADDSGAATPDTRSSQAPPGEGKSASPPGAWTVGRPDSHAEEAGTAEEFQAELRRQREQQEEGQRTGEAPRLPGWGFSSGLDTFLRVIRRPPAQPPRRAER